jgi:dynein heavy chain
VADEAPSDVKSNLRRAWSKFDQNNIDGCLKQKEYKACLFSLCFFHSLISGRIKFGAQGWSRKYPFNDGDLTISAMVTRNYLDNAEKLGTEVPWPDLRYIIGAIMYGGHITDFWDRRVNDTYLSVLMVPDLLNQMNLGPGFKSPDSAKFDYQAYIKYIEEKFPPESPSLYGMHQNAEIGYLTEQGTKIFKTIQETAGGSGGGGGGDIGAVAPMITAFVEQCPAKLDMLEIRGKLKKEDYTPYVIVSLQESDRMNILLSTIKGTLLELELGIQGALNITDKMEALAEALNFNKVYSGWAAKAYPSLKSLAVWFNDLVMRVEQLVAWTNNQYLLKSTWLPALFNPNSFLTAIKQTTAREKSLPLDFMTNRSFFTNWMLNDLPADASTANGGVFMHGLFLEGASWEEGKGADEGYIAESRMKELRVLMPVVNTYSVHVDEMSWESMYKCPVFITSLRGATFVYQANVRMDADDNEQRWILAGAAMLLTEE